MAREYHSASSDALGQRCKRAWWYVYQEGRRDRRLDWADIRDGKVPDVKPRERSSALGVAMHSVGEAYYEGREPDWADLPGRIFASGLHLLPDPSKCHEIHVEDPIGDVPITAEAEHAPPVALRAGGVLWAGFKDLIINAPGQLLSLGIDAPDGWCLFDYKSSSNIEQWALRPDALRSDLQANMYAFDACTKAGIQSIPARWVYFESKAVRRAAPTDTTITLDLAGRAVEEAGGRARELDTLRDIQDAEQNTAACGDYGGCPHHRSAGGPCDARRSVGRLIQLRAKKKDTEHMAFDKNAAKANFAKIKEQTAAAAPAETPTPTAETPKRGRGRPKNTAAAAEPAEAAALESDGTQGSITVPGKYAPMTITGDARDLLPFVPGFQPL